MPLIEVYARWRDKDDKPQQQFISSVSSPAEGLHGRHMELWLKDAVKAAGHVERLNRPIPKTDTADPANAFASPARDERDAASDGSTLDVGCGE